MGAGGRSGPGYREAGHQGQQQGQRERELRHEHAADEQRIRHGDVAQRGLIRANNANDNGPRGARFSWPDAHRRDPGTGPDD